MRWRADDRPGERPSRPAGPVARKPGWRYLLRRTAIALLTLLVATSLVFFAIHLGPRAPADAEAANPDDAAALEQKKVEFGLYDPLWKQYTDHLVATFTLDFGESWTSRYVDGSVRGERITDLNRLIFEKHLPRTAWLWLWAVVVALGIGLPVGVALGLSGRSWSGPGASVSGALIRATAVFVMVGVIEVVLTNSEQLLFGFDWTTFLVDGDQLHTAAPLNDLTDRESFLRATKHVLPAAIAVASGLVGTTVRIGERAVRHVAHGPGTLGVRARGVGRLRRAKYVFRQAGPPLSSVLAANVVVLVGASLVAEIHLSIDGIGPLFVDAVDHGDYTTVQATAFVFFLVVIGARLLGDLLYVWSVGAPTDRDERADACWTGVVHAWDGWHEDRPERLRALGRSTTDFLGRLRATPGPAAGWIVIGAALFALQFGAVLDTLALVPGVPSLPDVPTLLDRELWPNVGHRTPDGGWAETAFGLPAAYAWAFRVALVYLYAAAWVGWAWLGYRIYRTVYREFDYTPTDAALSRFRSNPWGMFGLVIVFVFLVAGVFAPTLGPTTLDRVGDDPSPEQVRYLEDGEVRTTTVTLANMHTESDGGDGTVGPMAYDRFDRFHPFGTTAFGDDLFTNLLFRLRTNLLVGAVAAAVSLGLALGAGLLSEWWRRLDAGSAVAAELTAGLPLLPVALLFVEQFEPIVPSKTAGTLLLGAIVGVLAWPLLWWCLRAPLARAVRAGWVEAASRSERPSATAIRRHVLPQVAGHLLAYVFLAVSGAIVGYVSLQWLWGAQLFYVRSPLTGRVSDAILTVSWHTDVFPTVAFVLLVVGFTALADGIRTAVDPTGEEGIATPGETLAAGGAG